MNNYWLIYFDPAKQKMECGVYLSDGLHHARARKAELQRYGIQAVILFGSHIHEVSDGAAAPQFPSRS